MYEKLMTSNATSIFDLKNIFEVLVDYKYKLLVEDRLIMISENGNKIECAGFYKLKDKFNAGNKESICKAITIMYDIVNRKENATLN